MFPRSAWNSLSCQGCSWTSASHVFISRMLRLNVHTATPRLCTRGLNFKTHKVQEVLYLFTSFINSGRDLSRFLAFFFSLAYICKNLLSSLSFLDFRSLEALPYVCTCHGHAQMFPEVQVRDLLQYSVMPACISFFLLSFRFQQIVLLHIAYPSSDRTLREVEVINFNM